MTAGPTKPDWYVQFRSAAELQPKNRGNIAAILVVLDRLATHEELRSRLGEILTAVPNEIWRGWAALSLVVTEGEGQIAEVTGRRVSDILRTFGLAARYIGTDGGRSSRGNFRHIRQLLGGMPAKRISLPDFVREIHLAQSDIIDTCVAPELVDNVISVRVTEASRPETIIGELLKQGDLRKVTGGVAQHLVGAKLARRFAPAVIANYSVFASDAQAGRDGDFVHGNEAFHVTVVPKPAHKLKERLDQNRERRKSATILVPRKAVASYRVLADEFDARLRSIEEYVGDNLTEMGHHDSKRIFRALKAFLETYNERVVEVERLNSGLEIKPIYGNA